MYLTHISDPNEHYHFSQSGTWSNGYVDVLHTP